MTEPFTLDGPVEHFIVGHVPATTREPRLRTLCGQVIDHTPPPEGTPRCPDCGDALDQQAERERQAEADHAERLRSADQARADEAEAAAIRRQADALDRLMRGNR